MDPGAYPEPLVRTTWVQVPMVSGYVGSRLRISDYAYGTTFTSTYGTSSNANIGDNSVHMMVENGATEVTADGTTCYFQMQTTFDDGPSGVRTPVTAQYGVVQGGRVTVDFYINAPFLEMKCVGGAGAVRAQLNSRLKWEQMAMDRTDTFGAPVLWQQKFVTAGVVAPSPFPTS